MQPPLVAEPQLWAAHVRPLAQLHIDARLPAALAYFDAYERYQRDNGAWWEWFDERLADLPADHPTAWLVRFERARLELQRAGGRLAAAAKLAQRCVLPGRDPPAPLLALFAALHARLATRPVAPPYARARATDFAAAARPTLVAPPAPPLAERTLLLHAHGLQLLLAAERALGLPPDSELASQAARWTATADRAHLPGLVTMVRSGIAPATVVEGAVGPDHPQLPALALLLRRLADQRSALPGPGPCALWRGLLLAQPGPYPPAPPPADPAARAAAHAPNLLAQLREHEAAAHMHMEPPAPAESQLAPTTVARSPARAIAALSRNAVRAAGSGAAALAEHETRRTRLVRLQAWGDQLQSGAPPSLVRSLAAAPELQPRAQQLSLLRAPRPARPVQAPPAGQPATVRPALPATPSALSPAQVAARSPTFAAVPSAVKPSSAPLQVPKVSPSPHVKAYQRPGDDSDSSAEGSDNEDEDTGGPLQAGTQQPFVLARPAFQLPAGSASTAPTTPSIFGAAFGQPAQLGTAVPAVPTTSTSTVAALAPFGTRGPALDFAGLAKPLTSSASISDASSTTSQGAANPAPSVTTSPFGAGFSVGTVSFGAAPVAEPVLGDWKCVTCGAQNSPSATQSCLCRVPRPIIIPTTGAAATTSPAPGTSTSFSLLKSSSTNTGPTVVESSSSGASASTSVSTPSTSLAGSSTNSSASASTSAASSSTSGFSFGSFGAPLSSSGSVRSSSTASTPSNSLLFGSFGGGGSSLSFSFSPTAFGSSSAASAATSSVASSAWLPARSGIFAAPASLPVSVFGTTPSATTASASSAFARATAALPRPTTGPFRPAGADAARAWQPLEGSDAEGQGSDDEGQDGNEHDDNEEEEAEGEGEQDDEKEEEAEEQDSSKGELDNEENAEEGSPPTAMRSSLGMRVRARQQQPAAARLAPLAGAFASATSSAAAAAAAAAALFSKPPPSMPTVPPSQPFSFAGPLKFELHSDPPDDNEAD